MDDDKSKDEIAEIVARAAWRADRGDSYPWDAADSNDKNLYRRDARRFLSALAAAGVEVVRWRPIAEAPRDGTRVLLLARKDRTEWLSPCGNGETVIMGGDEALHRMETGQWDQEGTSWVGGGLEKTGIWLAGGGWFQPDEVTHFAILRGPEVKP